MDRLGGRRHGPVLRLLQQRKARVAEFRELLARTVERLESLAETEQGRWRDLLTYILALVYNQRRPVERPRLQQTIVDSAHGERRQENREMAKTIAEALRQEGMRKGERKGELRARRETLLRLLRRRFGELPPEVVEVVESTREIERLDEWLDRILTAASLDDVRIGGQV